MKDRTVHLISLIIIVFFAGSTIWWMHHSYEHDIAAEHYTEHIKDYPLLDPALPFYDKDNLIVNIQELREYLQSLPEQNKDWAEMSIYFEVLNTGANISINNDLKIWPASLAKLPVAMVAMKKVENGDWDLEEKTFTVTEQNLDIHTKDINNQIGQNYTLRFVLERLLLESDNTAYRMLISELTEEELDSIDHAVGLDAFFTEDGKVSAKDYTRLLRALHSSTYLGEEYSQMLLNLMAESKNNQFLKAGVPSNVKVAHKWGINEELGTYADSGIIYLQNRPYLFSIMINAKDGDQEKSQRLIKEASERAFNFMKEQ